MYTVSGQQCVYTVVLGQLFVYSIRVAVCIQYQGNNMGVY